MTLRGGEQLQILSVLGDGSGRARQEQGRTRNAGQKAIEAPSHKVKSGDEE